MLDCAVSIDQLQENITKIKEVEKVREVNIKIGLEPLTGAFRVVSSLLTCLTGVDRSLPRI